MDYAIAAHIADDGSLHKGETFEFRGAAHEDSKFFLQLFWLTKGLLSYFE